MLLERSEISVKAGLEEDFSEAMNDHGLPLLTNVPGVIQARIGRGVENPTKFIFLVQWESLDAHGAFNNSEVHPRFLQLFAPYAEGGAMEHFQML